MDAFWIILAGSLVAASSAILGSFLLLRKMSMIGDAISHAVLPGIVIAFLISGSRGYAPVMIGAILLGVFITYLIEVFHKKFKLQEDASIGIVFTFLFAVGIILLNVFASQVDLDADCVLFGEIGYVPLNVWITDSSKYLGPINIWILGLAFLIISVVVVLGFKGLFLTTFDEAYAQTLGVSTVFWHYTLMSLVSLNTVVSFESVGAILVVAFLVVPAATAYLLTENFVRMISLAVLVGVLSVVIGYFVSEQLDTSIAATMAVTSGVFLIFAFIKYQLKGKGEKEFAPTELS